MCAIQLISARIGRVTGRGLAGNIRRYFPAWLLYPLIGLLVAANTINLGADLGAMAAALHLLVDGPTIVYVAGFAIVTVLAEVFISYARYASVLRWLTLSLFAYVGTVFVVGVPWLAVAKNLVLPHISLAGDYLTVVVAIFGTTISPYLFFWQAAEEVEDEKEDPTAEPLIREPKQAPVQMARMQVDTLAGMGFSNIIALFIMLTTAATLNAHGVTDIQTSSQAAEGAAPDRRPLRLHDLCSRHYWHRVACGARVGRQRGLRGRRGAKVEGGIGPTPRPRASVLRHDRVSHLSRRNSELYPARSH
jgi:Mn2+/Fe2+ NRAMP family transporter